MGLVVFRRPSSVAPPVAQVIEDERRVCVRCVRKLSVSEGGALTSRDTADLLAAALMNAKRHKVVKMPRVR